MQTEDGVDRRLSLCPSARPEGSCLQAVVQGIGQEGQMTGAFQGCGQHPLVAGTGSGLAAWVYARSFREVAVEQIDVFVVDVGGVFDAEGANLPTREKPGTPPAAGSSGAARTTRSAWAARTSGRWSAKTSAGRWSAWATRTSGRGGSSRRSRRSRRRSIRGWRLRGICRRRR